MSRALLLIMIPAVLLAEDPFARMRDAAARLRCIGQEQIQDGRIVRTWTQSGRTWTTTNVVPDIVGNVRQQSPFEERLANLQAAFADATNDIARIWADYHAATNVTAGTRAELEKIRDAAIFPATKAALQKIIDRYTPTP